MSDALLATVYRQPNGDVLVDLIPWTISGSIREQNLYALAFWSLVLGTALCGLALRRPRLRVLSAAAGAATVVGWLLCNGPGEGPTLLRLSEGNAIVTADLAALPASALVLLMVWRDLRSPAAATPSVLARRAS